MVQGLSLPNDFLRVIGIYDLEPIRLIVQMRHDPLIGKAEIPLRLGIYLDFEPLCRIVMGLAQVLGKQDKTASQVISQFFGQVQIIPVLGDKRLHGTVSSHCLRVCMGLLPFQEVHHFVRRCPPKDLRNIPCYVMFQLPAQ